MLLTKSKARSQAEVSRANDSKQKQWHKHLIISGSFQQTKLAVSVPKQDGNETTQQLARRSLVRRSAAHTCKDSEQPAVSQSPRFDSGKCFEHSDRFPADPICGMSVARWSLWPAAFQELGTASATENHRLR